LVAGIGAFLYLWWNPQGLTGDAEELHEHVVQVFKAEKTEHRTRVTAYGTSRAGHELTAIAEVRGRAIKVHPDFEPGETLPEGTLLVQIDPADCELAVAFREAELRSRETALRELEESEQSLGRILELQERQLEYSAADRDRQRTLIKRGATSPSAMELAERAHLIDLIAVEETRKELALIPAKRESLLATLEMSKTELTRTRRNLERCGIRLPFDARCVSKHVEVGQYVAAGERLGTFLGLEKVEVVAMLEVRQLLDLFPKGIERPGTLGRGDAAPDLPLWKRVSIPADVCWDLGTQKYVWRGRVARVTASLDPATRAVPVIIEVPNPYKDVKPGVRLALLPEVFCQVTLYGETLADVVAIPRDCVLALPAANLGGDSDVSEHAEWSDDLGLNRGAPSVVYVLRKSDDDGGDGDAGSDDDRPIRGTLHVLEVDVLTREGTTALISKGLEEGDLVIRADRADLCPAKEGTLLRGYLRENPMQPRGKGP